MMMRLPSQPAELPPLLVLTDRHQAAAPLVDVIAAAVEAGTRAVVLREKDLSPARRAELAAALATVVRRAGGVLLAAGVPLPGCDGVHLPAPARLTPDRLTPDRLALDPLRAPLGVGIVGQSCHDEAELRAAESAGVDYVTLSPVFATASKPGYGPALGVERLAALAATTAVPVYGLGGVESEERVRSCRSAGAAGVAVMGAVMRAGDPGRVVAGFVAALGEPVRP
jgi:thiamine-phosphate diphosphorylase